jgi:hypothetical protein
LKTCRQTTKNIPGPRAPSVPPEIPLSLANY